MTKYGVPARIGGKRNPEYWRAYNKTEKARECGKRYRKKKHKRARRQSSGCWCGFPAPSPSRRCSPARVGSKAWERDAIRRSSHPEAEAVGILSADELRSLL